MYRLILMPLIFLFACSASNNLLTYNKKPNFIENNVFYYKENPFLTQSVCYDDERQADEEYCYILNFTILDTSAVKAKAILDIQADKDILLSTYEFSSFDMIRVNEKKENNTVSGQVRILKWSPSLLILREDITVEDHKRKKTHRFVGKRSFRPAGKNDPDL